jgi:hypothetical protein
MLPMLDARTLSPNGEIRRLLQFGFPGLRRWIYAYWKSWNLSQTFKRNWPVLSAAGRSFPDEYAAWYADLLAL